jgi:hypothetical protein
MVCQEPDSQFRLADDILGYLRAGLRTVVNQSAGSLHEAHLEQRTGIGRLLLSVDSATISNDPLPSGPSNGRDSESKVREGHRR